MNAVSELPQPGGAVALKAVNNIDQPGTQFSTIHPPQKFNCSWKVPLNKSLKERSKRYLSNCAPGLIVSSLSTLHEIETGFIRLVPWWVVHFDGALKFTYSIRGSQRVTVRKNSRAQSRLVIAIVDERFANVQRSVP